jgi:chemotaxis protein CheX
MMLALDPVAEEAFEERPTVESFDGVISMVGIAGPWIGMAALYCKADLAVKLASIMLGYTPATVTDEVLDGMAELGNMITGNVKTILESKIGPLELSIPTVIYGRNYRALHGLGKKRIVVPFNVDGQQLMVKFSLAPQEEATSGRSGGILHALV